MFTSVWCISFDNIIAVTMTNATKPHHNKSCDIMPHIGYNTNQLCAQMVNIMSALNQCLWTNVFVKGMRGDGISDSHQRALCPNLLVYANIFIFANQYNNLPSTFIPSKINLHKVHSVVLPKELPIQWLHLCRIASRITGITHIPQLWKHILPIKQYVSHAVW